MTAPLVFLVDELPAADHTVLGRSAGIGPAPADAAVRPVGPGGAVHLADGRGGVAECTVESAEPGLLRLLVRRRRRLSVPDPRLIVVQPIPRGQRGDRIVELLTELGADEIVPWLAARGAARLGWERYASSPGGRAERESASVLRGATRWRLAARRAASRARRPLVPAVTEPATTRQVCSLLGAVGRAFILHPAASQPLVALDVPSSGDIAVVIGPRGGLTHGELTALRAAGATLAGLGSAALRPTTAASAALSVLSSRVGRWS